MDTGYLVVQIAAHKCLNYPEKVLPCTYHWLRAGAGTSATCPEDLNKQQLDPVDQEFQNIFGSLGVN